MEYINIETGSSLKLSILGVYYGNNYFNRRYWVCNRQNNKVTLPE